MTDPAWQAVIRTLQSGSKSMAAAEISSLHLADAADATTFIDHLLACPFSLPVPSDAMDIVKGIDRFFGNVERPERFTDHLHCEECAEHDATLRARTVKTITRDDLGNLGWSPMTFATPQGWAYYMPSITRYAITPIAWPMCDAYIDELASQLSWNGPENRRLRYCSHEQRLAVADLIDWIADHELELLYDRLETYEFYGRWRSWSDGARIWREA